MGKRRKGIGEMHIRAATGEDYEVLCNLFAEVDLLHSDRLPGFFRRPEGPARGREFFHHMMEGEGSVLLVAQWEGRVVGFVVALIRESLPIPIITPRRYAVIDSLGVAREFRRRGIGKALMDRAEEWALVKGIREMELNVWEFNSDAIAFYERRGFHTISRRMLKRLR